MRTSYNEDESESEIIEYAYSDESKDVIRNATSLGQKERKCQTLEIAIYPKKIKTNFILVTN